MPRTIDEVVALLIKAAKCYDVLEPFLDVVQQVDHVVPILPRPEGERPEDNIGWGE